MECFNHSSTAAVGTCKSCGRAVCRSCIRDLTFAVACSLECEVEAKQLQEMNTRAKRIYGIGAAKSNFPSGALMWGLFALMFGGFGIFSTLSHRRTDYFSLIFGAVCLILAILAYRRAKSLQLNC